MSPPSSPVSGAYTGLYPNMMLSRSPRAAVVPTLASLSENQLFRRGVLQFVRSARWTALRMVRGTTGPRVGERLTLTVGRTGAGGHGWVRPSESRRDLHENKLKLPRRRLVSTSRQSNRSLKTNAEKTLRANLLSFASTCISGDLASLRGQTDLTIRRLKLNRRRTR